MLKDHEQSGNWTTDSQAGQKSAWRTPSAFLDNILLTLGAGPLACEQIINLLPAPPILQESCGLHVYIDVGARVRQSLAITIFLTIAVPLVSADTLRAGTAQSVITPELNGHAVYLAGFGHNRVATGVHDDLYARCLALGIALCSLRMG